MSNRAFLISNNGPETAGRTSDGNPNYQYDTDVVAEGGGMSLPPFWLSLFNESHLTAHLLDDYRIPTLICERADGLKLLQERKAAALTVFTGYEPHWTRWEQLIQISKGSHFKLDATELWDLGPDEFEPALTAAVRWFTSGSSDDLRQLLGQSALYRDSVTGKFKVGSKDATDEILFGYVFRK